MDLVSWVGTHWIWLAGGALVFLLVFAGANLLIGQETRVSDHWKDEQ